MSQLPPEIVKLLEHIVAQERKTHMIHDQIRDEMKNAAVDLEVCLSPPGFSVLVALSSVLAHILNCEQGEKNESWKPISPAESVALADKFMLLWLAKRGDAPPIPDPERDQALDEFFQAVPEVKIT